MMSYFFQKIVCFLVIMIVRLEGMLERFRGWFGFKLSFIYLVRTFRIANSVIRDPKVYSNFRNWRDCPKKEILEKHDVSQSISYNQATRRKHNN